MKKKDLFNRMLNSIFSKALPRSITKKKAYRMLNHLLEEIKKGILSEEGLKISGFGTYRMVKTKRGKRVLFRPSKKLLAKLNSSLKRSKI
ncbi:MAG: hypothetical protein D6699_06825 [Aquificota bacterium]|nr:MAG: hypothetical protein D6699_06825 [Aquificota bacterium]